LDLFYGNLRKNVIKTNKQYLNNTTIENIEYRLKKAFHVIYKYNNIRALKRYNKFKAKNQNKYVTTRFANRGTSFERRHRNVLQTLKIGPFYGNLRKNK
jgi:hypothetical protein